MFLISIMAKISDIQTDIHHYFLVCGSNLISMGITSIVAKKVISTLLYTMNNIFFIGRY